MPSTLQNSLPAFLYAGSKSVFSPMMPPVIGVSGSSLHSNSVIKTLGIIAESGGVPLFIGNYAQRMCGRSQVSELILEDIQKINGVVILGNDNDLDPASYNEEKHPCTQIERDVLRAAYEEKLIEQALDFQIPLLCVCGGMQRLNVLCGGTLHQHLPDLLMHDRHSTRDIDPTIPVEHLELAPESSLYHLFDSLRESMGGKKKGLAFCTVQDNSLHHQAVNRLCEGFVVSAMSDDGIIEAIEPAKDGPYADQFAYGVQWHPEFGASPLSTGLFKELIRAAKNYAQQSFSPCI